MKNRDDIMSIIEKLEKEFSGDGKKSDDNTITNSQEEVFDASINVFQGVLGDRYYDKPLDPNIKENIRGLLNMLEDFYKSKIDKPDATNLDAYDYIPLFCINGALIASLMDIPYDDYLKLVDIMMVVLDITKEEV